MKKLLILVSILGILLISGCAKQQIQNQIDSYADSFPYCLSNTDFSCKCGLFEEDRFIVLKCFFTNDITRHNETHDIVSIRMESSGGSVSKYEFFIPHFEPIELPKKYTLVQVGTNKYNITKKEVTDEFEKCGDDDVCREFHYFLSKPIEKSYKVHYEYILKDVNSKFDINKNLNYEVKYEEIISSTEKGLPTEGSLKKELSNTRVNCDLTKEKKESGLICFNLNNKEGCDLYPALSGRVANECTYCFSSKKYLNSIECFGDSKYKEETENNKRYYKWVKEEKLNIIKGIMNWFKSLFK